MPKIPLQLNKRQWITIDASGVSAGRLATRVVKILLGKNNPVYLRSMPALDQWVRLENIAKIRFTGRKLQQKVFYHYTGYMGHLKARKMGEVFARNPAEVFRHIVRGMLPKNKWRDVLIKHIIFS